MVNAQQWLNSKYPTAEVKAKLRKLEIGGGKSLEQFCLTLESFSSSSSEPLINGETAARFWPYFRTNNILEGSLSLKGFVNLETIDCSFNQLTKLDLSDCSKLRELICHDNKLTKLKLPNNSWMSRIACWNNQLTELIFLDNSHTAPEIFCQNNRLTRIVFGKDSNIRFINCEKNQLTNLDLSNSYSILSYVYCRNNKLTSLTLPDHHYIQRLDCSDNQLSNLGFLSNFVIKSPEYFSAMPCGPFTGLKIVNNKFPPMDLSIFSNFTYLKDLDISDNSFYGSLKPLKNMASLWWLNISNTNIDSGLEYLPWIDSSFNHLRLVAELKNKNSRVKKIQEELKPFGGSLQKWKENWNKKTPEEKIEILEERLAEKNKEISVIKELNENWRNRYQTSQKEVDELQKQLSKVEKTTLEVETSAKKDKDNFERELEKLKEENMELEKSLPEVNNKGKSAESLEKELLESKKILERQSMQIVSLKSQYLTAQILNKQKELAEKQNVSRSKTFAKKELDYFSQLSREIQELRQQLAGLRLEEIQTQILVAPK
ncbi:MAG: hypothetical protein I3273_06535 [Candidatus Moeniiplasma glomeromycotorum]|nr:hypothetical protein [Candidatus Moeniiplasma glomeromycotorum]MCE8168475.1 hypothetical protein [Candidatus Moeniiplasma glomeromycotorum]MCE8169742.1 hypothetical protein [Candidatus Moeniiplasma glomeromycotorum]